METGQAASQRSGFAGRLPEQVGPLISHVFQPLLGFAMTPHLCCAVCGSLSPRRLQILSIKGGGAAAGTMWSWPLHGC